MPRVVPSQVVELIDKLFPWARDQKEGATQWLTMTSHYAPVAALLEVADNVPTEFINAGVEGFVEYASSIAALRHQLHFWAGQGERPLDRVSGLRVLSPVTLIRQALANCPDEMPTASTTELLFITDSSLRDSLRLDISAANGALVNGEWKAATVLAGSVVEALLLWTLQQKPKSEIDAAIGKVNRKPNANMLRWDLIDYIDVSAALGIVKPDTVAQCQIARGFRDLIHPGRVQRLSHLCNRGTALSAVAAIEHVVTDLAP